MVVFLHAEPDIEGWTVSEMDLNHWQVNIVGVIMVSISHVLAQTAVPLFFIISGFLFFKKLYLWDSREWRRKIKARIQTILIPYILWVAIFTIVHIFRNVPVNLVGWINEQGGILRIFWNSQNWIAGGMNILGQRIMMSGPFAFHLWFLRDLLVSFILTPAFYFLFSVKKENKIRLSSVFAIIILAILCLFQIQTSIPGVSFSTIFYFGLGCFISLNRISLFEPFYKFRKYIYAAFYILLIALTCLDGANTQTGSFLMPLFIFVGCGAILDIAAWWVLSNKKLTFSLMFENYSFFLFIIHPFFLGVVWSILSRLTSLFVEFNGYTLSFVNSYPLFSICLFFIKVAVAVLLSVLTYRLLMITFPKVTKTLCGR